jgi:hypothetical protein
MPTALNKALVLEVMGWTHDFAGWYKLFRKEQDAYVVAQNIRGYAAYGKDNWKLFMDRAAGSKFFIMKEKYRQGDHEVTRRLDLLLQDICKQYAARLNRAKRKYDEAMGAEEAAEGAAEEPQIPAAVPDVGWKKAVIIYLIDPEEDPKDANGKYLWRGETEIGVLNEPSMKELWALFAQYTPEGRHVREIWGAMSTPPAGGVPLSQQFLDTTEKVEAFFMLTASAPIFLMGVLSRLEGPNHRPNTPPGRRRTYLDPSNFAPPEEYQEIIEDKDLYISRHAGVGMKRLPVKDAAFETRLRLLRKKIRRLRETKAHLKAKHKAKYPDAIHSDDEASYYHLYYPTNGDALPTGAADFISRREKANEDATWAVANDLDHVWHPIGPRAEDNLQDGDGEFWDWE